METYTRTKTSNFCHKICFIIYFLGLPNFWIEDLKLSKIFVKIFDVLTVIGDVLVTFMILMEWGAFCTQTDLTDKHKFDMLMYGMSHPMLFFFTRVLSRNKDKVKALIYSLAVKLKQVHNDEVAEKQMMRTTVKYIVALNGSCVMAIVLYTFGSCMDVIMNGNTFTILITAWPDVNDPSELADVGRTGFYILWWVLLSRVLGLYMMVIMLVISLSHQFINLQSYFYSLSDIFERTDISQKEKEEQYEEAFKVGIEFHSDTLRCTYDCQALCGGVFSGQILYNILVMTVVFAQMMNAERNLMNLMASGMTASAVLISTGLLMWNSGDITVEASKLYMAMYFSGWENCFGKSSVRIRKLVVIAMSRAQIVKSSYSIFSVLY